MKGCWASGQTMSERASCHGWNRLRVYALSGAQNTMEIAMGFGKGILLWLLGIPIPIIILLALFWHH
jgi:hypothetical protein